MAAMGRAPYLHQDEKAPSSGDMTYYVYNSNISHGRYRLLGTVVVNLWYCYRNSPEMCAIDAKDWNATDSAANNVLI